MFAVPGATPVTTPVDGSTVAIEVLVLPHVPGDEEALRIVVPPRHTDNDPDIVGCGITAIVWVATQPLLGVYVSMAFPVDIPAIWSVGTGSTMDVLLEDHVPAPAADVSVVNVPKHMVYWPTMGAAAVTVNVCVV